MKRRWIRWLLWIALAAFLALAALVAFEWTYVVRLSTYPKDEVTRSGWYRPLERVAGAPLALPEAAAPGIAPEALAQAAQYAEEKGSAAFVVLHRGAIVAERYAPGHGPDARTNPMSMAKTAVALLVGIALAEGALGSLDEPAARHLHEWSGDERSAITIRHLLQMASGLANDYAEEDPFTDMGYLYFGTDSPWIVGRVRAHEPPGTRFDYNSINTQALVLVLDPARAARGGSSPRSTRRARPAARRRGLLLPVRHGSRLDHREPFEADDVVWLDGRHKQRVYVVPSRELVVARVGEQARK